LVMQDFFMNSVYHGAGFVEPVGKEGKGVSRGEFEGGERGGPTTGFLIVGLQVQFRADAPPKRVSAGAVQDPVFGRDGESGSKSGFLDPPDILPFVSEEVRK